MEILHSLQATIDECAHLLPELRNTVSRKHDLTPVTNADYLLDQRIAETLKLNFPNIQIVSEEKPLPEESLEQGWVAIVDPLDGTENFVSGLPIWGVAVSLWHDSNHFASVLSFPELGLSLASGDQPSKANSAVSGFSSSTSASVISNHVSGSGEFRVLGSAAFNLFCVATGRLKSFHNPIGAHAWDLVAGVNLALEQGCEVLIDGKVYEGQFLAPTKKYCVDVFNL
jgi:myo-inositol-1(or 4)-monophosphatase